MGNKVPVLLRLFGPQAQLAGCREVKVSVVPGSTSARQVLDEMSLRYPVLTESLATSRLAINHQLASDDAVIDGSEELAIIGMVGGG